MMRITRNGAACSRQRDQTPSASSALTDPSSKALVRASDAVGNLATSAVSTPADASAIAAVRPAGPAPTITTCVVKAVMPPPSASHPLRSSLYPQHLLAKARPMVRQRGFGQLDAAAHWRTFGVRRPLA